MWIWIRDKIMNKIRYTFARNKEESAEILCNIKRLIWHRTLNNLQTDEEKKKSKRNGVLKRERKWKIDDTYTQK